MRILVTGASGSLGAYVLDALIAARHEPIAWSGRAAGERSGVPLWPIDLAHAADLGAALAKDDPDAVLHLAAISTTAGVLGDPGRAFAVNVGASAALAEWSASKNRQMILTSTDLVFDGSDPWRREDDPTGPVVLYGRTKRDAEAAVLAAPRSLVARMPLMFGPSRSGRPVYFDRAIEAIRRGEPQTFFEDEYRTPLDYATAASILVRLVEAGAAGIVHVGGAERLSRYELMSRVAAAMGLDPTLVRANRLANASGPEPRPADTSMDTSKLMRLLPDLERPTIEGAAASWGLRSLRA